MKKRGKTRNKNGGTKDKVREGVGNEKMVRTIKTRKGLKNEC